MPCQMMEIGRERRSDAGQRKPGWRETEAESLFGARFRKPSTPKEKAGGSEGGEELPRLVLMNLSLPRRTSPKQSMMDGPAVADSIHGRLRPPQ